MKIQRLFLIFFLVLPAGALADDEGSSLGVGGRLFSNIYGPTQEKWTSETRALQQENGLLIHANPKLSEANSFRVEGEFLNRRRTADRNNEHTTVEVREGYYQYYKTGLEFRAGRLITPWGVSDGFNPTDFLTGKRRARFSTDEENLRTGADGLLLSYGFEEGASPWNITMVYNFGFVPSTFLLPPDSIPSTTSVHDEETIRTQTKNSEMALKMSYLKADQDFSFILFDGWARLPLLESDGFQNGVLVLTPRYDRIKALGLNYSVTLDESVLRFEAAYIHRSTKLDKAITTNSYYDAVLGYERPFFEKLRLQLQVLGRYFPIYVTKQEVLGRSTTEQDANESIATANNYLQGSQEKTRIGSTLRLSYGDQDSTWTPEIFVLTYPSTNETLLRAKLMHRFNAHLQFDVGHDRYFGPRDTAFGLYERFSSVFAEGRLLF
ncbi:MAG: DUF1302 family protein [Bdellovibrionales bacterium]